MEIDHSSPAKDIHVSTLLHTSQNVTVPSDISVASSYVPSSDKLSLMKVAASYRKRLSKLLNFGWYVIKGNMDVLAYILQHWRMYHPTWPLRSLQGRGFAKTQ